MNISFGQQELLGIEYQRPLMALLFDVHEQKATSLAGLGLTQMDSFWKHHKELTETDQRIGSKLLFIESELAKRGRAGMSAQNLPPLLEQLKQLPTDPSQIPTNAFDNLLNHLKTMILHNGDTSNLILDPDLDSYYMMDVVLLAIPNLADRIQLTTSLVMQTIRLQKLEENQKIELIVLMKLIQADLQRIEDSLKVAINEDANFYGPSDSLQSKIMNQFIEMKSAVESYRKSLENHVQGNVSQLDPAMMTSLNRTTVASLRVFWGHTADELNSLIKKRVTHLEMIRNVETWIAVIVFLLALLIAFWVGRSLFYSVNEAVDEINEISQNTLNITQKFLDELRGVSSASTEQAAALQETVSSLDEINAMVAKSNESAQQSSKVTTQSKQIAVQGSHVIEDMKQSIQSISDANQKVMNELNQSNMRILEIVQMMESIGQKTSEPHRSNSSVEYNQCRKNY